MKRFSKTSYLIVGCFISFNLTLTPSECARQKGYETPNNRTFFVEVGHNAHVPVMLSINNSEKLLLGGKLIWRKMLKDERGWVGECRTTLNNTTSTGYRAHFSKFDVKIMGDCKILCIADIKWSDVEYNDSATYALTYWNNDKICVLNLRIRIIVQESKLDCNILLPNKSNYFHMSCEWIAQHHYDFVEFRLGNRTGLNESTLHTIASSDDALCLNKAPHKCTLSGFSVEKSCQFFRQPKVEKLHDGKNSSVSFRCCAHEAPPRLWLYEKSSDHSFENIVGQSLLIEESKMSGCDNSVIMICGEETYEGHMVYGFLKLVVNSSLHIEVSTSSNGTNMSNNTVGSGRMSNGQCKNEYVFDILAYPSKDEIISTDDDVYDSDSTECEQSILWNDDSSTDFQMTTTPVKVLTQHQQSNCSEVYLTNGSHPSVLNNHPHIMVTVQLSLIIAILAFIFSVWTPVKHCYRCLRERISCSFSMRNDCTFVNGRDYPLAQNLNSVLSANMTFPSDSRSPLPENRFCQVGKEDQENGMNGISSRSNSIHSQLSSGIHLENSTSKVIRGKLEENTDPQAGDDHPREYPDESEPTNSGRPEIPPNNGEMNQMEPVYFSVEDENSRGYAEEKSNLLSAHQAQYSSHSCRKFASSVASNLLSYKPSKYSSQNEEISFLDGGYSESYPECLYATPHNRRKTNHDHTTSHFPTRDLLDDLCTSSPKSNGFCQHLLDEHNSSQTWSVVETDIWSPISVSPLDSSLSFTSTDSHDTLPSENNYLEDTV